MTLSGTARCICDSAATIKLMHNGTDEFWFCGCCNQAIAEDLLPDVRDPAELRRWAESFWSIYILWLASAEYEEWAAAELFDMMSPVNQLGINLVKSARSDVPVYYYLSWNESVESAEPPPCCPLCQAAWEVLPCQGRDVVVCESDRLLLYR